MIQRFDDWPEKLHYYLAERQSMPFVWGGHDCCSFASGAVAAQCGVDPMKSAYGRYKTARGAAGYISRNGGDLPAVAKRTMTDAGFLEVNPLMAGRGCIVMANVPSLDGDAPAVGVVGLDSRKALFVLIDTGGWFELPITECFLAWGFD